MKAYRVAVENEIHPFEASAASMPVLSRALRIVQEEMLADFGIELVTVVPKSETYLLLSDRTWFSLGLLELLSNAQKLGRLGQVCLRDRNWLDSQSGLNHLPQDEELRFELELVAAGGAPEFGGEALNLDWGLRDSDPMELHPSMAFAAQTLRIGPCMAIQISHWTDVLKANHFALIERAERPRHEWKQASIFKRLWLVLRFIFQIRSLRKSVVLRRIGRIGEDCEIHPTAVVEACEIGARVRVGPYAVLRGSVIGDGAQIDEHSAINLSVVGPNARVGRYAMANLCVLFEDAMISHGGGMQMSIFGKGAFVAWGAKLLDLSFGRHVRVEDQERVVSSGQYFLGAAIGNRAIIGNSVCLNYGVSIPPDALIVANADQIVRSGKGAEKSVAMRWENGSLHPIKKSTAAH